MQGFFILNPGIGIGDDIVDIRIPLYRRTRPIPHENGDMRLQVQFPNSPDRRGDEYQVSNALVAEYQNLVTRHSSLVTCVIIIFFTDGLDV